MNRYSGSILLLITAVSAACGYLVSVYAVSIAACIELGVCYLAVLGSAVIDFKLRIIPNYIPLSLLAARLLLFVYELLCVDEALSAMLSSLLGCFLCGVVLVIADKISKGGIGKGDIKLICSIGFVCGIYAVLTSLLLSMLSCILVAVILLLAKKKTAKDLLPFGPFIYLGFTGMLLLTLY